MRSALDLLAFIVSGEKCGVIMIGHVASLKQASLRCMRFSQSKANKAKTKQNRNKQTQTKYSTKSKHRGQGREMTI